MADHEQHTPTTECPPYCVMHVDGRHVGELDLAGSVQDFNIYTRPFDNGDGRTGLEVIVAKPDGTRTSRVEVDPDDVTYAVWLSELRGSFHTLEGGDPETPGDAHQ
jgi:hypothetical protein